MRHVKLPYAYWFIKVRDRDKKPITVWKNSSHDFHPKSYSHTHTTIVLSRNGAGGGKKGFNISILCKHSTLHI